MFEMHNIYPCTKVKLYPCDRCSVSFTQPISLKRHVNREHGVKKERMIKAETDPRSEQEIKEVVLVYLLVSTVKRFSTPLSYINLLFYADIFSLFNVCFYESKDSFLVKIQCINLAK